MVRNREHCDAVRWQIHSALALAVCWRGHSTATATATAAVAVAVAVAACCRTVRMIAAAAGRFRFSRRDAAIVRIRAGAAICCLSGCRTVWRQRRELIVSGCRLRQLRAAGPEQFDQQ